MISYIKGKVLAQGSDYIITETGGVGYKVHVAESRLSSFVVGQEVELYCYLHLKREETMELYGMESPQALEVFETIKSISGIGPKAALVIASLGSMEQLKLAIEKGDASYFARVHGIGAKKIQKIILELTGKLKNLEKGGEKKPGEKEVVDALLALGFSRSKAKEVLSQLPEGPSSLEEKVREALKLMRR
ncbi:MAG: Holliday junction branch migration protein RuvA [bacterium]|nr:Holliday junction branch migration protein RuvA [bacterium]